MDTEEIMVLEEMNSTKIIQNGLIGMVAEFMATFENIWTEMGISPSVRKNRVEVILQYVRGLFKDMLEDEKQYQLDLKKSIETYESELLELAKELGEVPFQPDGELLMLVELEKTLRTKLDAWNKEKYQRLKYHNKLRETEEMLCKRLALPKHDAGVGEVPTKAQLNEIEENNKYMENELSQAIELFKNLRLGIFNLWQDLEKIPSTDFERDLARDDSEASFVLSKNNLNALKELTAKLEKEQKENFTKAARLREQLKRLWTKLEIDEKEQQTCSTFCAGFKPSAIQKMRDEVGRLEALKVQHIRKFIEGSRNELTEIWDKCYFGTSQRKEFAPAFDENFTEPALALHEHQVEIMRNYYDENKVMFKLVDKRENMWKKFLEFESKENDPDRLFLNRGGALLKEMKHRNTIQKGLPKVEEDLKKAVAQWETENEKLFLVDGEKYLDLIEKQWTTHEQEKQILKEERQKAKQIALNKESVFGCKPTTPAKRATTPSRTPLCKRLRSSKINSTACSTATTPSKLLHASVIRSPLTPRTNLMSPCTKPPKVAGGKVSKNPRRRSTRLSRKPLKKTKFGQTLNSTSSGSSKDSTVVISKTGGNVNSLLSCTSYSDFTSGLKDQQEADALNSTRSQMVTFV